MTPKAGRAVIAEFERRGNDIGIDLRHGMIDDENPTLEKSFAYGWIPCPGGLEYVDGDGLYARGVQWDPKVKLALQAKPPRIKYFSPTYDVDPKTRVVLSLTNIALTNLPATHGLNRLAAERGRKMDLAKLGALLAMLMQKADAGDQEAAAMRDAMIAALGDQAEAALAAANAGVEDAAPDSSASLMAAMSDTDKAAYEAMSEPMKAAMKAGVKAMQQDTSVAAEKPEEVKAEKEEDKKSVAASISAEQLLSMADGELAKHVAPRQKIVAELVASRKLAKGGDVERLLLDPSLSDETFAKVVAARKIVSTTIGKAPVSPLPTTKNQDGVPNHERIEAERFAKKMGSDPKKILAQLAKNNKAE
jgi:hypothetical protein